MMFVFAISSHLLPTYRFILYNKSWDYWPESYEPISLEHFCHDNGLKRYYIEVGENCLNPTNGLLIKSITATIPHALVNFLHSSVFFVLLVFRCCRFCRWARASTLCISASVQTELWTEPPCLRWIFLMWRGAKLLWSLLMQHWEACWTPACLRFLNQVPDA